MRAMIVAAGLGKRMGILTEQTPKPLLKVAGRYLIEYSIEALVRAGIHEIVINLFYHKEQIMDALGNGARYGAKLSYSVEEERLETGGGIIKALPLLGQEPFIVMSSDIITDYPLLNLRQVPLKLAHLVMVENPAYHLKGDYSLNENSEIAFGQGHALTFANIALLRPELFKDREPVYCRLADLWKEAIATGQVGGECYRGFWYNVGTPQELITAEEALKLKIPA